MTILNKSYLLTLSRWPDIPIDLFNEIDSTNEWLKTMPGNDIRFCIAKSQTKGRGQWGRRWHSPASGNIYLSCRWPFQPTKRLSGLSLAISLAVLKAIQRTAPAVPLKIKWPNDLLFEHQKLAGILIELKNHSEGCSAVIGIGINVNMPFKETVVINQPWTSLRTITGGEIDLHILIAELMNGLIDCLHTFENQGFSFFMKDWQAVDYLFNKIVNIKKNDELIQGIANGIDKNGALIVRKKDNTVLYFDSGEARLQGNP